MTFISETCYITFEMQAEISESDVDPRFKGLFKHVAGNVSFAEESKQEFTIK